MEEANKLTVTTLEYVPGIKTENKARPWNRGKERIS